MLLYPLFSPHLPPLLGLYAFLHLRFIGRLGSGFSLLPPYPSYFHSAFAVYLFPVPLLTDSPVSSSVMAGDLYSSSVSSPSRRSSFRCLRSPFPLSASPDALRLPFFLFPEFPVVTPTQSSCFGATPLFPGAPAQIQSLYFDLPNSPSPGSGRLFVFYMLSSWQRFVPTLRFPSQPRGAPLTR